MNGVIVIAPADARWATAASAQLAAEHLLHARLYEPSLLSMLVRGANVLALAVDERLAEATATMARRCGLSAWTRMLVVHERSHAVHGSLRSATWPADVDAMRAFIGVASPQ